MEAVDYEINRMGRVEKMTAVEHADWRLAEVPRNIQNQLQQFHPPMNASNLGDALGYLLYAKYNPRIMGAPNQQSKKPGWPSPWKGL